MTTVNVLKDVERDLAKCCAKLQSVQSYQEEFYDRMQAKHPELVEETEEEMGTDDESKT